jgi:hypothetical protein
MMIVWYDGNEHQDDVQTMTHNDDDGKIDAGIRRIQSLCFW